jgi:hypothetical protein
MNEPTVRLALQTATLRLIVCVRVNQRSLSANGHQLSEREFRNIISTKDTRFARTIQVGCCIFQQNFPRNVHVEALQLGIALVHGMSIVFYTIAVTWLL